MTKKQFENLKEDARAIFNGDEYLLIGGTDTSTGWAIATEEEYDDWLPSYAHLFPDGRILRFRVQIGTYKDLKLIHE